MHFVASKVALCYGGETWTINRRDARNMEAAQMRFYGRYLLSEYPTAQGTLNICTGAYHTHNLVMHNYNTPLCPINRTQVAVGKSGENP